jgi:lipopolysaccharide transport system ATP-binding protein
MTVAIRVENVSKRYRLGNINRDMLYKEFQSWWARKRGKTDPHSWIHEENNDRLQTLEDFWALRDVSFDVHKGEVMGILGKNGSGKSTLLKILSRITAPTHGRACIRGRVTSLLEVGTGFHEELTGRENVYLNGSILGMKRGEISRRFDEIVAFSEIEKFIDTPVKRYSSGMRVRLAFSVAAHLECDIMIIDEVLAVGDAPFQERCMQKIKNARADGRTILFVSHSEKAVQSLCDTGAVLGNGHMRYLGPASEAVAFYAESLQFQ